MSRVILGGCGFDTSAQNISAGERGVKDAEIVALGKMMAEGHFAKLETLNVVRIRGIIMRSALALRDALILPLFLLDALLCAHDIVTTG